MNEYGQAPRVLVSRDLDVKAKSGLALEPNLQPWKFMIDASNQTFLSQ